MKLLLRFGPVNFGQFRLGCDVRLIRSSGSGLDDARRFASSDQLDSFRLKFYGSSQTLFSAVHWYPSDSMADLYRFNQGKDVLTTLNSQVALFHSSQLGI